MTLQVNALCTRSDLKAWATGFDARQGDTDLDELIDEAINVASDQIEDVLRRKLQPASVTEARCGDGTPLLSLARPPIRSLTSVVIDGVAIDLADVVLDDAGTGLARVGASPHWPIGRANIVVTYDGGFSPVPARFKLACRELAYAHLLAKGIDPLLSRESGQSFSRERDAVEPFSGLPSPVWRLIQRDRLLLLAAVTGAR